MEYLIKGGKIRESGMPPEEVWVRFFNVNKILNGMKIDSRLTDIADFACGYGTFTVPAAQKIRGIIYAIDLDPQMVHIVEQKSIKLGLTNVRPIVRDLLHDGSGLLIPETISFRIADTQVSVTRHLLVRQLACCTSQQDWMKSFSPSSCYDYFSVHA